MIDYYSTLAGAVANLGDENTAAQRHDIYARARKFISTRLREGDPSAFDREMGAFEEACRRVETNSARIGWLPRTSRTIAPDASLSKLGRELLLHLFGDDGLSSLRAGNWTFIAVIAPVFGFFADVCTVFGDAASTLLVVFAIIGVVLTLPIALRTRYCRHCAIPCVFSFILVIAFGFVTATQKVFAAQDAGVAAKFIPGIPEIQDKLAEMLDIQKETLTVVTDVQSDTRDIKKKLTEANTHLAEISAATVDQNKDPRKRLASMGLSWDIKGFVQSVQQKDSNAVSLYFDGGWKLDMDRLWVFSEYFDKEAAQHLTNRNIDPEETCPAPKIYSDRVFDPDRFMNATPELYFLVEKYGDEERNALLRRVCGVPSTIHKIDKISDLIRNYPSVLVDQSQAAVIARWRHVRQFLTGDSPPW